MPNDLQKKNRDVLEKFIRTYESEPCLWQLKSKEYHDRKKRNTAYNRLVEILQEIDPTADRVKVVKKINSLRTNRRKETRKLLEKSQQNTVEGQIYEPGLWYYHLFDFLEDQDQDVHGCWSSANSKIDEEYEEHKVIDPNLYLEQSVEELPASSINQSPEKDSIRSITPEKKSQLVVNVKALKRKQTCDRFVQTIEDPVKKSNYQDDRGNIFSKNISMKLKDLSDNKQRLLAERLINEAVFLAEMGELTLSHSINTLASTFNSSSKHANTNHETFAASNQVQVQEFYEITGPKCEHTGDVETDGSM